MEAALSIICRMLTCPSAERSRGHDLESGRELNLERQEIRRHEEDVRRLQELRRHEEDVRKQEEAKVERERHGQELRDNRLQEEDDMAAATNASLEEERLRTERDVEEKQCGEAIQRTHVAPAGWVAFGADAGAGGYKEPLLLPATNAQAQAYMQPQMPPQTNPQVQVPPPSMPLQMPMMPMQPAPPPTMPMPQRWCQGQQHVEVQKEVERAQAKVERLGVPPPSMPLPMPMMPIPQVTPSTMPMPMPQRWCKDQERWIQERQHVVVPKEAERAQAKFERQAPQRRDEECQAEEALKVCEPAAREQAERQGERQAVEDKLRRNRDAAQEEDEEEEMNRAIAVSEAAFKQEQQMLEDALRQRSVMKSSKSSLGVTNLGALEELSTLAKEFKFNVSFVEKVHNLTSLGYSGWRRVRGDGNCFYRAVGFGLLELLLAAPAHRRQLWTERLLGKLTQAIFKDPVDEMQHKQLIASVKRLRYGGWEEWSSDPEKTQSLLYQSFCEPGSAVDLAMIRTLRQLTSNYLQEHADDDKMNNGISFEVVCTAQQYASVVDFCSRIVLPMGVEAEGIILQALSAALDVDLKIAYLDRVPKQSAVSAPPADVSFQEFGVAAWATAGDPSSDKPLIQLQLRPGHYDLLYQDLPEVAESCLKYQSYDYSRPGFRRQHPVATETLRPNDDATT